jgi:hypothetical protein
MHKEIKIIKHIIKVRNQKEIQQNVTTQLRQYKVVHQELIN